MFTLYPLLKRVTPLCHFGVGAALALSPLGGFLAVRPDVGAAFRGAGALALFATFGWRASTSSTPRSTRTSTARPECTRCPPRSAAGARSRSRAPATPSRSSPSPRWALARWPTPAVAGALVAVLAGLAWQQKAAANVDLAFFRINAGLGFVVLLVVLAGQGVPGWNGGAGGAGLGP